MISKKLWKKLKFFKKTVMQFFYYYLVYRAEFFMLVVRGFFPMQDDLQAFRISDG